MNYPYPNEIIPFNRLISFYHLFNNPPLIYLEHPKKRKAERTRNTIHIIFKNKKNRLNKWAAFFK